MIKTTEDYPTPALVVWFERLKFCACGNPEAVLVKLRDCMRSLKNWSDYNRSKPFTVSFADTMNDPGWKAVCDAKEKAFGDGAEYWMAAYILTAADLEEHGGSAPGWLTEDGEQLLAFLESAPEDAWMSDPPFD